MLLAVSIWHWRRKWQPTPVFLPEKFHGQRPGGIQSKGSQRVRHDWATADALCWTGQVLDSSIIVERSPGLPCCICSEATLSDAYMFVFVISSSSIFILSIFITYFLIPNDDCDLQFYLSKFKFVTQALVDLHLPEESSLHCFIPCHIWNFHNLHKCSRFLAKWRDKGITETEGFIHTKWSLSTLLNKSTKKFMLVDSSQFHFQIYSAISFLFLLITESPHLLVNSEKIYCFLKSCKSLL